MSPGGLNLNIDQMLLTAYLFNITTKSQNYSFNIPTILIIYKMKQ